MAEETPYDSEAMRRFAGIELGDDRIPDESTILNFRHLLERHGVTEAVLADVNADLADTGITLRSGTLVDATIIDAPSSTKNKARARDPEMSSTKSKRRPCPIGFGLARCLDGADRAPGSSLCTTQRGPYVSLSCRA